MFYCFFFFQAEDGIRDLVRSRGLGDVYKRQAHLNQICLRILVDRRGMLVHHWLAQVTCLGVVVVREANGIVLCNIRAVVQGAYVGRGAVGAGPHREGAGDENP
eukprot:TRINITY_DN4296_c0_g2_i5.p1 TRINITY_DN4296_c0_g2~~TRINITY_DN4296_c0_g2_i5.p1  ORF type:complete len:104 (+),score=35.86 TRINITY_DN4296_c0_g2_i5:92-403(+)